MKYDVVTFLDSINDRKSGSFKFWPGGKTTLLSSCFGVQLCFLINRLDYLESKQIGSFIYKQQHPNGLFIDNNFDISELSGRQSDSYLRWQSTFFSLIALDMIDITPRYPLRFIQDLCTETALHDWFEQLNWHDFWYSSNEIMFLLYFLSYARKHEKKDEKQLDHTIKQLFLFLNTKQDSVTGFWGNETQQNPTNGMYGAAHIYLFYEFFDQKIQYGQQVISNTLALQQQDGLYGPHGGGACEDYDGIEILVRLLKQNAMHEKRIQKSLMQSYEVILNGQQRNGGFPYRISLYSPEHILQRVISTVLGRNYYCYSGWEKMKCKVSVPDIWATYFRVLSLALIEKTLSLPLSYPYQSYELPGWGYLGGK